jgi:hypothetical protein
MVDNNWNHFVLTFFKSCQRSKYTYYFTFRNKHYERCGNNENVIHINYDKWLTSNTNIKLNKIVFCSKDVGNKLTYPLFKRQCEFIQWLDGYYRRLQIFDITYSAKQPIFNSDEYEDD